MPSPSGRALVPLPKLWLSPWPSFSGLCHSFLSFAHHPSVCLTLSPSIYFRDKDTQQPCFWVGQVLPFPALHLYGEPMTWPHFREKVEGIFGPLPTLLLTLQPHVSQLLWTVSEPRLSWDLAKIRTLRSLLPVYNPGICIFSWCQ